MDSIIQTIIDVLSERYGARNTPGWVYAVGVIVTVTSTISAKEIVKKRKALRKSKADKLEKQVLKARLFSQEDGLEVEYNGCIMKESNSYRLIIEATKNGETSVNVDVIKETLDDVAEYLRGETKFILADFKQ